MPIEEGPRPLIYKAWHVEKTFCATRSCLGPITLLSCTEATGWMPAFYICDTCGFIGQVGVGKVRENKDVKEVDDGG